jgi:fatty acid kinase fatty acid binding subunit
VERLIGYGRQRHADGADAWVVQHIRDPESAESLVEACRPIFGRDPLYVSEVGPVLGANTGPGMIGIGASVESAFE